METGVLRCGYSLYEFQENPKMTSKRLPAIFLMLVGLSVLATNSLATLVFETNFDNVQTWNPAGYAACWQDNVPIEGGSGACSSPGGPLPLQGTAHSIFNDYRHLSPQCSIPQTVHIGSSSDIEAIAPGASFTPYGGSGKSYVHFYEPCMSSSGGWGSDGLLGIYFGKTTGYSELYVQMKVRFQPGFSWQAGSQQKLMHITHFNEDYNQGVLQAYEFFNYNLPDFVPGIYHNVAYDGQPQFYLHSSHTDKSTDSPSPSVTPSNIDVIDGSWHTLQFHVKLNSAANSADGIKEMWIDGQSVGRYANVPYTKNNAPSPAAYGFNRVIIGGNSNNLFGTADGRTQWYAVDDLVVSTIPIPEYYCIGNCTGNTTTSCGDGTCNGTENCTTCANDCGACSAVCGDRTCGDNENCTTCMTDCGACPIQCLLAESAPCDGCIDATELSAYIAEWKTSAAITMKQLIDAIALWKSGC
jgi:hypothetical protein